MRTHTDVSVKYTLLLMAISTACIGLLPTDPHLSFISVSLLCICRLLQGVAMGGSYGASYLYVSQTAKKGHKNRATAFVAMGFMIGFILGNTATSILYASMSESSVLNFGWRLPFLAGGALSFALYTICNRTTIIQTEPEKAIGQKVKLSNHLKNITTLIKCIAVIGLDMIGFYVFFVFNPNYLNAISFMNPSYVTFTTTVLMIVLAGLIWLFSYLTDKWHNDYMLVICSVLFILLGINFPWVSLLDHVLGVCMLASCYAALPNWVISQFKGNRNISYYTGLSFSLASVLFAGTTPIVATLMVREGTGSFKIAMFSIGVAIFSIVVINMFRQSKKKSTV